MLLDLSYGIPIAVHCLRGRNMLPERNFVLPNLLGWVLNIVCFNFIHLFSFLPVLKTKYVLAGFAIIHQLNDVPFPLSTRVTCYRQQYE